MGLSLEKSVLSHFLYNGTTFTMFSLSGKIPVVNILLIKTYCYWFSFFSKTNTTLK